MIAPLILLAYLIACVTCLEMYCEGRERNQFDKQFFAGCFGAFLIVFGMARWL